MELRQILQDFVNEPYETLVGMAKSAIAELTPIFSEIAEDGNGAKFVIPFFATSLAVDGRLSDLEYKFVCDIFGDMTYDEVKQLVEVHYSDKMIELIDGLADSCPVELKSKLITLCCCFLAVDETISRDEVAFVQRLCEQND